MGLGGQVVPVMIRRALPAEEVSETPSDKVKGRRRRQRRRRKKKKSDDGKRPKLFGLGRHPGGLAFSIEPSLSSTFGQV